MKGRVINYRGGMRTQRANQMIVLPENSSDKESASKLIGRKVEWTTPSGNKIVGKIRRPHGRKGAVIVKFNKGLPGQSLGTDVDIMG